MMDLKTKKKMSAIKIIELNAEVSTEKTIIALVFKIDNSGIYISMTLIN